MTIKSVGKNLAEFGCIYSYKNNLNVGLIYIPEVKIKVKDDLYFYKRHVGVGFSKEFFKEMMFGIDFFSLGKKNYFIKDFY